MCETGNLSLEIRYIMSQDQSVGDACFIIVVILVSCVVDKYNFLCIQNMTCNHHNHPRYLNILYLKYFTTVGQLLAFTTCTQRVFVHEESKIRTSVPHIIWDLHSFGISFTYDDMYEKRLPKCFAKTLPIFRLGVLVRQGSLQNIDIRCVRLSGCFQDMSASHDHLAYHRCSLCILNMGICWGIIPKMSLAEHSGLPILGTTSAYKELKHAMVKPVLSTHASNNYHINIWSPLNPLLALLCSIYIYINSPIFLHETVESSKKS